MASTAKEQIREALVWNLTQIVKGADNGHGYVYNNTIKAASIGDPPRSVNKFREWPGVNLHIGEEVANNRATPLITGNKNIYDLRFQALFECFIKDVNDTQDAKDRMTADLQGRFGPNYYLPNEAGARTVFQMTYIGNVPWGIEGNVPVGGVHVTFDVSYRVEINNPNQLR